MHNYIINRDVPILVSVLVLIVVSVSVPIPLFQKVSVPVSVPVQVPLITRSVGCNKVATVCYVSSFAQRIFFKDRYVHGMAVISKNIALRYQWINLALYLVLLVLVKVVSVHL